MRSALLLLTLVALSACSTGSRSLPSSAQAKAPPAGVGSATFTLTIPDRASSAGVRRSAFVSPSVQSGTISIGGTTTELNLGVSACTSVTGGRACTFTVPAALGADTCSLALYDGAFTSNAHSGTEIGAASAFSITVHEGQSNVSVPLVVGGIPVSADVSASGLTAGTASSVPLIVTAYDHDSNVIVGPAAYVNAAGTATPLTVALRTNTTQVTLHNGAQSGSSITISSPTDSPTLQLSAPADILGVMVKVTSAGATLPTVSTTDAIAVSGTMKATQLAAGLSGAFDDEYLGVSDATVGGGMPDGIVFSGALQSGGVVVAYFNAATEGAFSCTYTQHTNLGVGAVPGGVLVGFNAVDNVDQAPTGLAFVPIANIFGGSCNATLTTTNASFALTITYDTLNGEVYEIDHDGSYQYDVFNTGTGQITSRAQLDAPGSTKALAAVGGVKYIPKGATLYAASGNLPLTAHAAPSGASLSGVTYLPDGTVYVLDNGTSGPRALRYSAGSFTQVHPTFGGSVAAGPYDLAIGHDGSAYAIDGNSTVRSITPSGTAQTVVIPAPNGYVGYLTGIFDGRNGYLYAWYDDQLHASAEYIYRISN